MNSAWSQAHHFPGSSVCGRTFRGGTNLSGRCCRGLTGCQLSHQRNSRCGAARVWLVSGRWLGWCTSRDPDGKRRLPTDETITECSLAKHILREQLFGGGSGSISSLDSDDEREEGIDLRSQWQSDLTTWSPTWKDGMDSVAAFAGDSPLPLLGLDSKLSAR